MVDQEVQTIINNLLFTIIIIVPVIGMVLSLWVATRPLPPYAGKNGNEYMPAGKKGGPIEVED